jgi:hypothetical protein
MLDAFLSRADCDRVNRTLEMLHGHETGEWVLAGGLAIELHCLQRGPAMPRALNDIDFVVDGFERIPGTLRSDLLFRHVHPHDPMNKTLIQAVDARTGVRVDVFRAGEGVIERSEPLDVLDGAFRIVSIEDLKARNARLSLDLAEGKAIPAKHAHDFLRLLLFAETDRMEGVWQEHRKSGHPATFAETAELLENLIPATRELQVVPVYAQDVRAVCPHCEDMPPFAVTAPELFLSLLGYC